MIGILNYGLGNIKAFSNIYKSLDIPYKVISKREELVDIKKIILPGVGAFDNAMNKFNQSGLRESVEKMVLKDEIPILGVCVGMQILGNTSEEGFLKGLGWINGDIKKIQFDKTNSLPLPHMGWNDVNTKSNSKLFFELELDLSFYFLHSF